MHQLKNRYGVVPSLEDVASCIQGAARGEAIVIRRDPEEGTCVVLLYWDEPPMEIQAVFRPSRNAGHQEPGAFVTALEPGSYAKIGPNWVQNRPERGYSPRAVKPRRRA